MNASQNTLAHYPLLPFARPRTPSPNALRSLPVAREERPAPLWRDSLKVGAGPLERAEGWAFLALTVAILPAVAISQSVLWHLLDHGRLDRVIHAFLVAGGL